MTPKSIIFKAVRLILTLFPATILAHNHTAYSALPRLAIVIGITDTASFISEKLTQTDSVILNGNVKEVFPLFGAFEERKWAEGWNPTLIYPASETIAEGTTFKTKSHFDEEKGYTWIVNKYDVKKRLIQYLVYTPNRYWTITVQCTPAGRNKTLARITYTYTGLNELGNHINRHSLNKIYEHHLKDWKQDINAYLDKQIKH